MLAYWYVLVGYVLLAGFCIVVACGVRALVRALAGRSPRTHHDRQRPRAAKLIAGAALSAVAGFSIGIARDMTDDHSSLSGAVPAGLGVGTLFLVVYAALVVVDWLRA